jgi:hypothetical protein
MFAASKSGRAAGAAPTPTTDATFGYVPLLLNTTSTDGQQNNTFLDSSTNNFPITRNGTPTQGSITPYWPNGQWSNYFGSSNYLSATSDAAFAPGGGDFTIEAWVYPTSAYTTYNYIFGVSVNNGLVFYVTGGNLVVRAFNVADLLSSATIPALNTWTHVAATKSGTILRIFVNGIQTATTTNSTSFAQGPAVIGNDGTNAAPWNGYISNFRLVKGVAVYTTTPFIPSTTPLTRIQSANVNGNPSAAITGTQTSLLTCQSNRFIDNGTANSGQPFTITVNGTPTVQAFQPFSPTASYTTALYGGSGYFNGSTDYLTTPITASGPLDISTTTTYTIEAWVYWTASAGNKDVWTWGGKQTGGPSSYYQLYWATTGNVLKWEQGSTVTTLTTVTTSLTPVLNTWYHIAIVRSGSSITVYANGKSIGTGTYAPNDQQFAEVCVGSLFYNTGYVQFFSGYVSNFRFVKGTAVYTGEFTPPTLAPLTTAGSTSAASYSSTLNVNTSFAASNTSLLLNMTNAGIYDAAVQNNAITVGNAQASLTPTAQWPPTSMKFNGSTDYLQILNSVAFDFGTATDFTIECWIYPTTLTPGGGGTSNASVLAACLPTVGTLNGWLFQFSSSGYVQFVTFVSNTEQSLVATSNPISINTWTYVAVTRSGSTYKLFVNGTQVTTTGTITQAVNSNGNPLKIGAGLYTTFYNYFTGSIEDLRITKGVARTITASPAAPFPTR